MGMGIGDDFRLGAIVLVIVGCVSLCYSAPDPARPKIDAAGAEADAKPDANAGDVLEGVLRVHPKFHYRYYIQLLGGGQTCALFRQDARLQQVKLGSLIRVQGKLASKFFGDPKNKNAALVPAWIIYMDVSRVEVLQGPVETSGEPPSEKAREKGRDSRIAEPSP